MLRSRQRTPLAHTNLARVTQYRLQLFRLIATGPLQVLARNMRLEGEFDFVAVAAKTPGYVGADMAALTKEAGATAITRVFSTIRPTAAVRMRLCPLKHITDLILSFLACSGRHSNRKQRHRKNLSKFSPFQPMGENIDLHTRCENWLWLRAGLGSEL